MTRLYDQDAELSSPRSVIIGVAGQREVVHECPVGDGGETPCCGRMVFELPRADRLSAIKANVTCSTDPVGTDDESGTD